jgi:hypothetical protein
LFCGLAEFNARAHALSWLSQERLAPNFPGLSVYLCSGMEIILVDPAL